MGMFCFRHRWIVLGAWLLVLVGGVLATGQVFANISDVDQTRGSESAQGSDVLKTSSQVGFTYVVLVDGIDATAVPVHQSIQTVADGLHDVGGVAHIGTLAMAKDGRAITVPVTIDKALSDENFEARSAAVGRITDRFAELSKQLPGSQVSVGGGDLVSHQAKKQLRVDLATAEYLSLPLTLVVLVLVFGGLIAAAVPVLAAIVTVVGSFGMLLLFSTFVDLDDNVVTVVSLLGLGLAIDYGLLLVTRYREELARGLAHEEAVRRTWATAGRTVAYSGTTVAAALAGMLVIDVPRLQAIGAAGISTAVVGVFTALTFTAAVLGVCGDKIKPSVRAARREADNGRFAQLARFTQRNRWWVTGGATLLLLIMATPLLGVVIKVPQLEGLPNSLPAVQVASTVDERFDGGDDPAISVVSRTSPAALDSWAGGWTADPIVAHIGSAQSRGPDLSTVNVIVHGDPQSAAAQQLVVSMRANRPSGAQSWVIGPAATLHDLNGKITARLPEAVSVTVIAMWVLMMLMTGSVVVPLKALLMNVLSLGATFGVLVAIFQDGWLSGPLSTLTVGGLSPFVIVIVTAFAVGLSMDYELFLLGRIKEYVDAGEPNDVAVRRGLQHTGRTITCAAGLMLIVFAVFGAAKIGDIEEVGIGLFTAVLIDSTLVRCLLVPAIMTLLGRWNWWAPWSRPSSPAAATESFQPR